MNTRGLLSRASDGFPTYIGMIPRVLLHAMSRQSPAWFVLFYFLAVPMALLILLGFVLAWRRGLHLSAGFAALFWIFAAMWPWRDPRFLAPLLPLLVLFLMLGVAWCATACERWHACSVRMSRPRRASLKRSRIAWWGRWNGMGIG